MSDQETIKRVLELVSHLGGPECTAKDLEWATDIPAGKQALEWLANQLPDSKTTNAIKASTTHKYGRPNSADNDDYVRCAALSPVALYKQEMDILTSSKASEDTTEVNKCASLAGLGSYELPAQLRSRTESLDYEAKLLEKHAARLQHRLNASKTAAKDLKQAINALRKQIQTADQTIQDQQQRMTELSVETDTSISKHVNLALRFLDEVAPQGTDTLDQYKTQIAAHDTSRASAATAVKQLQRTLEDAYGSLPSASELQHDATILCAKLKKATKDETGLVQAACIEELEKIAQQIEQEGYRADTIERILQSASAENVHEDVLRIDVNVKDELERAGKMDQLVLLKAHEGGLDMVTNYMRGQLIPQLRQTYGDLHARSTLALETEALVSALIEELEDVNDAVESAKGLSSQADEKVEGPEDLVEGAMIDLLKDILASREDRPTILLNRSDVDTELAALAQRLSSSRLVEEDWASGLPSRIRNLSSSQVPLLSAAYANSSMNTSPPFAPSSAQDALREDTRAKADELMEAAARLQKETVLSSRDKRKIKAFVEKWVQTSDGSVRKIN